MKHIRRWHAIVALVVVVAAAAFFAIVPGKVDRSLNRIAGPPLPKIRPDVRALHRNLTIADMHGDTLLWKRSLGKPADHGQIDLDRLVAGNVALQVFSSVSKTPRGQNYESNGADSDNIGWLAFAQLQPPGTWFSLLDRSLWHAQKLDHQAAQSGGRLRVIHSQADIDRLLADRAAGRKVVGGMLSLEGLQVLKGDIAHLGTLYAAGFRMAGLTHFFDNEVAGSMHGLAKGGLTPLGRQVVRRMEAIGMIVDVAHASHDSVAEVLKMARRPVVYSHGGVQATCNVNRNLTDAEIRGIAGTGGVVGIGYWDAAVCSTDPKAIAAAIAHVRDVGGIDHVGLGSDFDGAVTTGFDTGQVVQVTQALVDRGFTPAEIRKVMGGNVLRVLRGGIVPGPRKTKDI